MRRFTMLLEMALENLQTGAPLVQRLNELLRTGKVKIAQKSPQGFIYLQKLGLTNDDKKQLMQWGAWEMEASTNEWILDLRKVPGIQNPSAGNTDAKQAIRKAMMALGRGKISPGDIVASSALGKLLDATDDEVMVLRKLGVIVRNPEGGFSVDDRKLKSLS